MDIKASNQITLLNVDLAGDDIVIGGRNLFLATGVNHTNNDYNIATYEYADIPLTAGEVYTATICVTPAANVTKFGLYFSEGYARKADFVVSGTSKQIISSTFTMGYTSGREPSVSDSYARARLYRFPYDDTVTDNSTIHWFKLEKGNMPTDWTPAPEDVDSSINKINTRVIEAETQIESNKDQIALRATKTEVADALETYKKESQAELDVMADKVEISVSETMRQEIKAGDDELRALYNEMRMNYDFTSEGQFIGKSNSDTKLRLTNAAMDILVANSAVTTVDQTGLIAYQAHINKLLMGNFTVTVSSDGNTLTLT